MPWARGKTPRVVVLDLQAPSPVVSLTELCRSYALICVQRPVAPFVRHPPIELVWSESLQTWRHCFLSKFAPTSSLPWPALSPYRPQFK